MLACMFHILKRRKSNVEEHTKLIVGPEDGIQAPALLLRLLLVRGAGHSDVGVGIVLILSPLKTLADQSPQGLDDADVLDPRLLASIGLLSALAGGRCVPAVRTGGAGAGEGGVGGGGVNDDLRVLFSGGAVALVRDGGGGVGGVVWVGAALEHAA